MTVNVIQNVCLFKAKLIMSEVNNFGWVHVLIYISFNIKKILIIFSGIYSDGSGPQTNF